MERFAAVFVAGGLGSLARYGLGVLLAARVPGPFPVATLLVNVLGCFLMAVAMQASLHVAAIGPTLRVALGAGFLGGFTTYSAFNYDLTRLYAEGARGEAVAYFLATTLGSILAGLLGLALARQLFATAPSGASGSGL